MINVFKIRFLQFKRITQSIGLFRVVFFLGLILFLSSQCATLFKKFPFFVLVFVSVMVTCVHISRKDFTFIKTLLPKPNLIFCVEYLIISFPILIVAACSVKNPVYIIGSILYILFVSHTSILRIKNNSNQIRTVRNQKRFLPSDMFEWLSGLRKYKAIYFIYIFGLGLSFLPYASCITMLIITYVISSFFVEIEPLLYVFKDEVNEQTFLNNKIRRNFVVHFIILIPLLALGILFNPDQYLILIYGFVVCSMALIAIIVSKYATYYPSKNSIVYYISSAIILSSIIFPPLLLITIAILILNYNKSLTNLKKYLDAYN